jgi:hypothetical protein
MEHRQEPGPEEASSILASSDNRDKVASMFMTIDIDGKKVTVELPEEVVDAMKALAARHRITLEEAVAQAVVNQKFLEDEIGPDGELIVRRGDRDQRLQIA